MRKVIFLLFCCAVTAWGNPLGFRSYQQTFTLEFADEASANAVKFVPCKLPGNSLLAFSSRWDDTTMGHLKTHEVMVRKGMKGTFYLNYFHWAVRKDPEYLKKLLAGGCSLGNHTLSHPLVFSVNANELFYEYMAMRILIETGSQSPVNSQAFPYWRWWSPLKQNMLDIGHILRAGGVISAPDSFYPDKEGQAGFLPGVLAQSLPLTPGDHVPAVKLFQKQLTNALKNTRSLEIQPSVSMAMHSWHTPEGLIELGKCYDIASGNPQWWYCNQNEYGAYRYEAQHCSVSVRQRGRWLDVTVKRFHPGELGADVPLSLGFFNSKPLKSSFGKLHEDYVELPHSAEYRLPQIYCKAAPGGFVHRLPAVSLTLRRNGNCWTAVCSSKEKVLKDLQLTFRFPPGWQQETMRVYCRELAPGKTEKFSVEQNAVTGICYLHGRPYYVVQADFICDDIRYRIFAELREKEYNDHPVIGEVMRYYRFRETADLMALSQPGILPDWSAEEVSSRKNIAPGVLNPQFKDKGWQRNAPYIGIVEFTAGKEGVSIPLLSSLTEVKGTELFFNGKQITAKTASLVPQKGRNRLLIKGSYRSPLFLDLGGCNYVTFKEIVLP